MEEITRTIYKDNRGIEHLFKREAQLSEIGYAIHDVTDMALPAHERLQELLSVIPSEHYNLLLGEMNETEQTIRRESLPEKLSEYMKLQPAGPMYVMLDSIARKLEEDGFILLRKR